MVDSVIGPTTAKVQERYVLGTLYITECSYDHVAVYLPDLSQEGAID